MISTRRKPEDFGIRPSWEHYCCAAHGNDTELYSQRYRGYAVQRCSGREHNVLCRLLSQQNKQHWAGLQALTARYVSPEKHSHTTIRSDRGRPIEAINLLLFIPAARWSKALEEELSSLLKSLHLRSLRRSTG